MKSLIQILAFVALFCLSANASTAEPPVVNVTFRVDMSYQQVSEEGVFFGSSIYAWEQIPMEQITGEVWEITVEVPINYEVLWKFLNGPDGWEDSATMNDCTITSGIGGPNRTLLTGVSDISLPPVCFSYCSGCDLVSAEEEVLHSQNVNVHPNPASDVVTVSYQFEEAQDLEIWLVDVNGGIVFEEKLNQGTIGRATINLAELDGGIYFLFLSNENWLSKRKIVVNQ